MLLIGLAVAAGCGVVIALLVSGDDAGDTDLEAPPEPGPLAGLAASLDRQYDVSAIAESALPRAARPEQPPARPPIQPAAGLRFDLPGASDGLVFLYEERTGPGRDLALGDAVTGFYGMSGCGRYVWFIDGEEESPGEAWIRHVGKVLRRDGAECKRQWSVIT